MSVSTSQLYTVQDIYIQGSGITKDIDIVNTHRVTDESDIVSIVDSYECNWTTWTKKYEEMFWLGSVGPPICKLGRMYVIGHIM